MKKTKTKYPLPIREWSEDDRPREKLLKYGEHTLSNAELLAILIRTGTPGRSAVDIRRDGRELRFRGNNTWDTCRASWTEFRSGGTGGADSREF